MSDNVEQRKAWAVIGNSDLTEGRGASYIKSIHWLKASAIRAGKKGYVMGTDCPVEEVILYERGPQWYGPVCVQGPTKDDERTQAELDKVDAALEKARKLGMTDEELATLGYFK